MDSKLKKCFALLLISLVTLETVSSSKILVLHIFAGKSHKNFATPIIEALAEKGHEITWVSPYKTPFSSPRLKDIVIASDFGSIINKVGTKEFNSFDDREKGILNLITIWFGVTMWAQMVTEIALNTKEVTDLYDQKFDLVIMNGFFNDASYGVAYKVGAPVVQVYPAASAPWHTHMTGNPTPSSFVPNILCPFTSEMSFLERTINFLSVHAMQLYRDYMYYPAIQEVWNRFDPDMPDLRELELMNTSLIITNSHFGISGPQPVMPTIVEAAGAHCRDAKPLPKDLEEFVSGSGDDGFILFSLGSTLNASQMPDKYRIPFINAFSKLKQRVLWKWETGQMDNLPPNVKLSKWLPQQDILGHPKIKAFITHGGLLSTLEATYHGVPLIGIPFYGDQDLNVIVSEKRGYAIKLDLESVTEETVSNALDRIINIPSYKENMMKKSIQFRDQYPSPLDRAVYWIEYVIRHKGAHHLKSIGATLPWYQYHLFDVYIFLIAILITIVVVAFYIVKGLWKCVRCLLFRKSDSSLSSKKRQ